jgi:hypothetical protein
MAKLRTTAGVVLGLSKTISERIDMTNAALEWELATLPDRMAQKHEEQRQEQLAKQLAEDRRLAVQMQNPEFAAAFEKHMLTIRAAMDK